MGLYGIYSMGRPLLVNKAYILHCKNSNIMSTIFKILDSAVETLWEFIDKYNNSLDNLNNWKAELSGGTFTGDISVPDEAYGAGWNGSTEVPTKNAIYDKIEALPVLSDWDKGDIVLSSSGTVWTIDTGAVTTTKLWWDITTAWKALLDDADASAQRTTLWLNTTANQTDSTDKRFMTDAQETKLDGLTAFIWCELSNSTSQTLAADSYTAPAWNTEVYDTSGFHTWSQNQITIPTTGYYLFTLNLEINVVTGNYNMFIYSSTGKQINSCQSIDGLSSSFSDWVSISWVMKCTAWDTINSWVHLSGTSSSSRTLLATNSYFNASLIWI